ncbi:MAG: site-2 protease family protein [Propionibacteriaceae bacterium]|jgi:membrane-associated protease RseP (regulator of RpoE activity)|nr:site-2 protease family protein [Propionibacteriaceae bacterium]
MSLALDIIFGVIFFALILVSVGLHELGHFIPAKLFHVKVLQFFIGFGKNIWKTQRGETEYGVKMIPLGGYVRLLGSYPPYKEGKNTRLKRLADTARAIEWEDITDEDVASGRLVYQQPVWKRIVIMASGVMMNLLLAFGLFLGVNLGWGVAQESTQIASVGQCVDPQAAQCVPTPAAAMGLQVGDVIVAFNGVEYNSWASLVAAVQSNGANPVQVSVLRDGVRMELPQVPGVTGPALDPNDPTSTIQVGKLGMSSAYVRVKVGPVGTLGQMWEMVTLSVKALVMLPVSAVTTVIDMVTGQPRDIEGPISIVGASVIAGQIAGADGVSVGAKVSVYLYLLGSLNLFVGVMNLIPLMPFDGGQVASGIYEAIRRAWAKLRGRPDPGPADVAKLLPVTYVVGGLFLIIGVILIIADIVSPVSLF